MVIVVVVMVIVVVVVLSSSSCHRRPVVPLSLVARCLFPSPLLSSLSLSFCLPVVSLSCPVVVVIVVVIIVVVIVVVIIVVLVVAVMVVPVGRPCPPSYAPHFHPASSGPRWWFWVLPCMVVTAVIMVKTYQ